MLGPSIYLLETPKAAVGESSFEMMSFVTVLMRVDLCNSDWEKYQ